MNKDTEFQNILKSLALDQTFEFEVPREDGPLKVKSKQLTTLQLKELIKSSVDSPFTQAIFNSTATNIFDANVVKDSLGDFNFLDRLIFLLEARRQCISSTKTVTLENKTEITINFDEILTKLREQVTNNIKMFTPSSAEDKGVLITFAVAPLTTEAQFAEYIKTVKEPSFNGEDFEQIRKIIGDAFINEIAKGIQTISVNTKSLNLSVLSFKERLETVEQIPAGLIQKAINYIDSYRTIINDCLTVGDYTIPIDSTLFAIK